MVIKCAIYARVSTDMQGQSLENQVYFAQEFIARLGDEYTTDESLVYQDFDQSGYYTRFVDRDAIQRALRDAKAKKFQVIVFKELSRISRDQAEHHEIIGRFQQEGVRVIAINDNLDTDKPETLDLLGIKSWMSEMESKGISSRVSTGRKSLVRATQRWIGEPPIGYKLNPDTKQLEVDESFADIPKLIFDLYVNHGYGTFKIAEYLNTQGLLTKNNNRWSRKTVNNVLKNPVYTGKLVYGRTRNELKRIYNDHGYQKRKSKKQLPPDQWIQFDHVFDPIIDDETFQRAKELMSKRSKQNPRRTKHPLTGLLICGKCGGGMICQKRTFTQKSGNKAEYRYYSCSTAFKYGRSFCSQENINAIEIEKVVWELILEKLKKVQTVPEVIPSNKSKQSKRQQEKSIERIENELKKQQLGLDRLFTSTDLPTSTFNQLRDKFVDRINELERQLVEAKAKIQEDKHLTNIQEKIPEWLQQLYELDLHQLDRVRSIFHELVEKIVVNGKSLEQITLRYF
jgi:site-specific DNA recombinase